MNEKANEAKKESEVHTITLRFEGADLPAWKRICDRAKADRRTPSEWLLIYVLDSVEDLEAVK